MSDAKLVNNENRKYELGENIERAAQPPIKLFTWKFCIPWKYMIKCADSQVILL